MKKQPLKADSSLQADPSQFLSGWKEIANFLGMGVRTVQRYERELGLPVRRPAAKARGSVVAVAAEIDGWVKASPIREVFHLRNAPSQGPSPTRTIHEGVSELMHLREQMSTLRSELHESVQRLHDNVESIQRELIQRELIRSKHPSTLYSWNERDLLDRTMSDLITAPVKYPKAS